LPGATIQNEYRKMKMTMKAEQKVRREETKAGLLVRWGGT
jgi:hypothetical protein